METAEFTPVAGQEHTVGDMIDRTAPAAMDAQTDPALEAAEDVQTDTTDTTDDEAQVEESSDLHTVVLEGKGLLTGSVNGVEFAVPQGVEIKISTPVYNAVKAYIAQER